MTGAGRSCPCHPDDINDAIRAHRHIVEAVARHTFRTRPGRDGWDDVMSDGHLALWRALTTYDPDRSGDLETWLTRRVRFRMIDGLRSRTGRGSALRPPTQPLFGTTVELAVDVDELMDDRVNAAVDATTETTEVYLLAAAIDTRLPEVLRLLGEGHTRTEIAVRLGVTRTRIWQLTSDLRSQLTQRASA